MIKLILIISFVVGNISCGPLALAKCAHEKCLTAIVKSCVFNQTIRDADDPISIMPNKTWNFSILDNVDKTISFYDYYNMKFIIFRQSGEKITSEVDLHRDCAIDKNNGLILNQTKYDEIFEKVTRAAVYTSDKHVNLVFNLNFSNAENKIYIYRSGFTTMFKYKCSKNGKVIKTLLFNLNGLEFHKFISHYNDIIYYFNKNNEA